MTALFFQALKQGLTKPASGAITALPPAAGKIYSYQPQAQLYHFSASLARSWVRQLSHSVYKCGNCRQMKSMNAITRPAFNKVMTVTRYCHKAKTCQRQSQFTPKRFASKNSKIPYEISRNISKDVLVYSHKNDSFYKMLSYFGLFQMAMWSYLAMFAVQQLKSTPALTQDTSDMPWWKKLLYKEGQYKNAISILCVIVGGSVVFITMTYPRRAIRTLWILKGGKDVTITTHGWLGGRNTFSKPVEHINCLQSRIGAGNHIPLKIKGKNFYFLLDKQGQFHNTDLFDFVIGLKRSV